MKNHLGFHPSFSRHGIDGASSTLLVWLNGNVSHFSFLLLLSLSVPTGACAQRYEVKKISGQRILIDRSYEADKDAEAYLAPYKHKVDSIMSPVVGRSARFMKAGFPESALSNLLTDILVWGSERYGEHPDLALYNLGGIRAALPEGVITFGDINDIAPFENKICFLTLTGAQLKRLFSQVGHKYGSGVSHSVKAIYGGDELQQLLINGEAVSDDRDYRVATIDYLISGNDGFRELRNGKNLVSPQDKQSNTRYIIAEYFKSKYAKGEVVDAKVEGRIVINK